MHKKLWVPSPDRDGISVAIEMAETSPDTDGISVKSCRENMAIKDYEGA